MEALKQMGVSGKAVTGVIHVGANNGQERFQYQAANVTPVIYVEPIEAVFNNLKQNIAGLPGHIPVQALCSDKAGERVVFNISSNNGESSSMLGLGHHASLFPSVTYVASPVMTTTTVDAIVSALELPSRPNLLVLDTQGTELKVLQGARNTLRTIDGVFVEVSQEPLYDGGCTHDDIREFLQGYDFELQWLAIHGLGHGDAFYSRKRVNASSAPAARGQQTPAEMSIVEALSLLTPYDIDKIKDRVGPCQDGGYILLPELFDGQTVMSYGIGAEYRFDTDMASRGHPVLMFDHIIDGINHDGRDKGLRWIKEGVAGRSDYEVGLDTIENQISKYAPDAGDLILKMDVEGFEYEAFDATPRDVLRRFQQIVFEIHDLQHLARPDFRQRFVRVLTKLNSDFTLFHVHANNVDGPNTFAFLSGIPVSNLLELSYVRTDLVARKQSRTVYPTPLDYPNVDPLEDKKLWFFPFLPTSVPARQFSDADQRMRSAAEGRLRRPQASMGTAMNTRTDLMNVAAGKPAQQSSSSEWSTVGEAANAVADGFVGEFAFHTRRELGPWWQVDLLSVYPIEAIIVHNRRGSFQDRACSLKVEISERGDDWMVVHTGFARFGSTGDGQPLELSVGGKLAARYVRLSLTENEYLHLSHVEVLVRRDLLEFKTPVSG